MATIKIKRTDDAELVRVLHSILFPSDIELWEPPNANTAMWVAYDGTRTAGFCVARRLAEESAVFLEWAGVFKDYSGYGLQRRMVQARVAWAKKIEAKKVITYATHDNWRSIANLIRCDFHFYEPDNAWAGRSGVHYFMRDIS